MTWQQSAACRDLPTELFYPDPNKAPDRRALDACAACPVRLECSEAAYRHSELGLWGGLTENARNEHRRRRRIPKPAPPQREALRNLELDLAPLPKDPRHREYRRRRRMADAL